MQWDFLDIKRRIYNTSEYDTISLTVTYPNVGDTIRSFILSPAFIPGVVTHSKPAVNQYNFTQDVEFPDELPIGSTSGVKWLRHFAGTVNFSDFESIDTAQNGNDYFIAGMRDRQINAEPGDQELAFISKLNRDGLSLWEMFVDSLPDGKSIGYISSIKHANDGGCIVLGQTYDNDATYDD